MSQLTGRYTGSSESQIQKDLDMIAEIDGKDPAGFTTLVNRTIDITLTNDFWEFNAPQLLISSSYKLSPIYQCFLAALNILDADMFMLRMKVREWMDPALPARKGTEGHHLFPRHYLESVLGLSDNKRINQAANFAPTDWDTNQKISGRPPTDYWPELVAARRGDDEWLERQLYWHALPKDWHELSYDEFLSGRRQLIARVTRDAFDRLGQDRGPLPPVEVGLLEVPASEDRPLSAMFHEGYLLPGDLLDPLDPDHQVDAVITEDGTLQIDGLHEFDSLDDAARYLEVTNISGFEFWALEMDGGLASLSEVMAEGPRNR